MAIEFKIVLKIKSNSCVYALELLRLSCEGHFSAMQNFLRE